MTEDNTFPSPDGRYTVEISSIDMMMSHEVDSPTLIDTHNGTVLFDPGELWESDDIRWSADSKLLQMAMCLYPDGSIEFELSLEPARDFACLKYGEQVIFSGTMQEVGEQMEESEDSEELIAA